MRLKLGSAFFVLTLILMTYQQCAVGGNESITDMSSNGQGGTTDGSSTGGTTGGTDSGTTGDSCPQTNSIPYVQAVCHWDNGNPYLVVTWQDPPPNYRNPNNQSMIPNHGGGVIFNVYPGTSYSDSNGPSGSSILGGWAANCCGADQTSLQANNFTDPSTGAHQLSEYIGQTVFVTKKWNTAWHSGFPVQDAVVLRVPIVQCNCQ